MNAAFGEVLPLAIAIAASPFPIVPAILLLFTVRPLATAGGFLTGWFIGIAVTTTLFTALASVIELQEYPPAWVSWTRLALGGALVVLGVRQWLNRSAVSEQPAWMASLSDATPGSAGRLGLLLSAANPKVLLLTAAAGLAIGAEELPATQAGGVIALFTVVAAVSVATPVAAYAVSGETVLRPLGKARDWLEEHNDAIMAAVILVLGVALLAKGITGL